MTPTARSVCRQGAERGQSETLGLVLVFGMVILGASAVVVLGSSAIGDSERSLSTQRAEKVLTQFDSKAALVALDNTDVQSVKFARRETGQFRVAEGAGSMNLTILNTSSSAKTMLVNQSLGKVTYTNGGDELAYQGGGVWKRSGNGSVMISPPEFHFRNGTLTLPIINVTGDPSLGRGAAIQHTETIDKYPTRSPVLRENPLDEHRIFVVVKSRYYQAWGQYFTARTDGTVKYDHENETATLELVSPLGKQNLNAATASRSASGTFELHGSASSACGPFDVYTNSYNSSASGLDYCGQTPNDNGHVIYGSDIDVSGGTGGDDLRGNLVSGGTIDVTDSNGAGQPEVWGHINHTDDCFACSSQIRDAPPHEVNQIDGVATMNNINLLVETKVDDVRSDNDNAGADITASDELDFGASSPTDEVTLTAGTYYLDDIVLEDDETLILDTTSGDVTLAVNGGIRLKGSGSGGGTIEVDGPNVGKVYVGGKRAAHGRPKWDVKLGKNAAVLADGDNATQFRLYGRDRLNVTLAGSGSGLAKYVGVIFAPPGRNGIGEVTLDSGEIFGGILTGTTAIHDGSIHYDEALANTQVITRDAKVVKVTFLHVTVNRVAVSNG